MWKEKKSHNMMCVISIYSLTFAPDFQKAVHTIWQKT